MIRFTKERLNELKRQLKLQNPNKEVVFACIENGEAIFGVYNIDAATHYGGFPIFIAVSRNLKTRRITDFSNRARLTALLPDISKVSNKKKLDCF